MKVDLVTTDVRVIGNSLYELKAEDFTIYDDKVAQEVTFFSYDQLPLAVAILVDKSGSVRSFFPLLQIASLLSLKQLKPEDEVALFSFSDSCDLDVELTTDRLLIAKEISQLEIVGGTELFKALYKTAQYLREKASDRRRAIILVSDNFDESGNRDIKRSLNEILESAITLYSIRTNAYNNKFNTHSNDKVKELADKSGGELLDVDPSTSLQVALEKAITDLRYQFTLGFNPSAPGEAGSYHKLEVRLTKPDRCPECRILTRRGYYSGIRPAVSETSESRQPPPISSEKTSELLIQRAILTAGTTQLDLADVLFTVKTDKPSKPAGRPEFDINLNINPSKIGFKKLGYRQSCNLHITLFYADKKGKILGHDWKKLEGALSSEQFIQVMQKGLLFTTTVPMEKEIQMLKVVVYDEISNRIGSKLVELP